MTRLWYVHCSVHRLPSYQQRSAASQSHILSFYHCAPYIPSPRPDHSIILSPRPAHSITAPLPFYHSITAPLSFYHRAPCCQNGAKSRFEMCFGPSTLGAEAKPCLKSSIKKFTPHCVGIAFAGPGINFFNANTMRRKLLYAGLLDCAFRPWRLPLATRPLATLLLSTSSPFPWQIATGVFSGATAPTSFLKSAAVDGLRSSRPVLPSDAYLAYIPPCFFYDTPCMV